MSDNKKYEFYQYNPSKAAAVIFIILFVCTTALHSYQMLRTRTWFLVPLVLGGFFEWIGYVGRAESASQTPNWTLGPFILQTILILIAPAMFAASVYMELGRIILLVNGEDRSMIRKKWLTKIFVFGDVFSFLLQSGGGSIMAGKTASKVKLGQNVVVIGLLVQIFFFGFFMIVSIVFNMRMNKFPTGQSMSPSIPWRKHMHVLYAASMLILVRSLFRVIEFVQGNSGYLLHHEIFLYIFDAFLMLVVMVLFDIVHPSEINALLKGGKVAHKGFGLYSLGESL